MDEERVEIECPSEDGQTLYFVPDDVEGAAAGGVVAVRCGTCGAWYALIVKLEEAG